MTIFKTNVKKKTGFRVKIIDCHIFGAARNELNKKTTILYKIKKF